MKEEKDNIETRESILLPCRDKHSLTATSTLLSRQELACHDKHTLAAASVCVMLLLSPPYVCGIRLLYINYIYCVFGFSVCEMMRSL